MDATKGVLNCTQMFPELEKENYVRSPLQVRELSALVLRRKVETHIIRQLFSQRMHVYSV